MYPAVTSSQRYAGNERREGGGAKQAALMSIILIFEWRYKSILNPVSDFFQSKRIWLTYISLQLSSVVVLNYISLRLMYP